MGLLQLLFRQLTRSTPKKPLPSPTEDKEQVRFNVGVSTDTATHLRNLGQKFGVSQAQMAAMLLTSLVHDQDNQNDVGFHAVQRLLRDHQLDLYQGARLLRSHHMNYRALSDPEVFSDTVTDELIQFLTQRFYFSRRFFNGENKVNHKEHNFYTSSLLSEVMDSILDGTFDQVLLIKSNSYRLEEPQDDDYITHPHHISVILVRKYTLDGQNHYRTYQPWGTEAWNYMKVRLRIKELLLDLGLLSKLHEHHHQFNGVSSMPYAGLSVDTRVHQSYLDNEISAAELVKQCRGAWYPEDFVSKPEESIKAQQTHELTYLQPITLDTLRTIARGKIERREIQQRIAAGRSEGKPEAGQD
ncbi:hypothetical protein [Deinococcus roseus]|uniref:Uncharacterized protein n=1 Tax=Deinococcus roseus TaxID=392414 RepID=A0ABQ2D6K1_9DEIO|nr:hypothetical protein [Deinococcus roseus]GGJ47676.1 hypothetical protein GCM10008938_37060 [Deinococcus roseus]